MSTIEIQDYEQKNSCKPFLRPLITRSHDKSVDEELRKKIP